MIDFSDVPKVAYDEMNTIHAEEVELLNTIEVLLNNDAQPTLISDALEALFDHTREHFSKEETLMQKLGFPAFRIHKSEHDRVLTELQYVIMNWRSKKDNAILKEYFGEVVPAWLHQHISSMDTVTAQFIANAQ